MKSCFRFLLIPLLAGIAAGLLSGCSGKVSPDPAAQTAPVSEPSGDPSGDSAGAPSGETPDTPETEAPEPSGPSADPDPVSSHFPKGRPAKTLVRIPEPSSYGEKLTLATLQGLAARGSDEQILIRIGAADLYTPYIEKLWGAEISNRAGGKPATFDNLLAVYRESVGIEGYILCASDPEDESVSVAVSLAGILNAVVATPDTEAAVKKAGYPLVLDVTGKDDKWLRASEYWDRLSRTAAFEQPASMAPKLIDYAVMANAYFNFYSGNNPAAHKRMYEFLDDGAVIFGYNNTLGEHETVKSFSELNLQMVPSDHAYNLSTLSGFSLAGIRPNDPPAADPAEEGKQVHTLCIVMSDGDNIQWVLNNFATSNEWYGNSRRGDFAMGWGIAPSLIDVAAPMLSYLYDKASAKDGFLMQLSGLGYTFPSRWDADCRREMAAEVAESMRRCGLKYAEILDDNGFREASLGDFTAQEAIEGLFYIEYSGYASLDGKILWTNGKPAVSARYMIWADHPGGGLGYIARKINRASVDPKEEDAYSFLIVHAWSGMKDGKLVPHGNTLDAVAELIAQLDEDVEIVTPDVFMERLIENCGP